MAKKLRTRPTSRQAPERIAKATLPKEEPSRPTIAAPPATGVEELFADLFGGLHKEARSAGTRDDRLKATMIADSVSALLEAYRSGTPSDLAEPHRWAIRQLTARGRLVWFGSGPHDLVEAQACVLAAVHRAIATKEGKRPLGGQDIQLYPAIDILAGIEDMRAAPIAPPLPQQGVDPVAVVDRILNRRAGHGSLDPAAVAREVLVAFGASRPDVDKLFKSERVEERAAEMLKKNVPSTP